MDIFNTKGYLQDDEKYGFSLMRFIRKRKSGKLYIDIDYYNHHIDESATFTLAYASKGVFKDIKKHKEIEDAMKELDVIEGLAFVVNERHKNQVSLTEPIQSLPKSLITNEEAEKNLIDILQEQNKELVDIIAKEINMKREACSENVELN